MNTKRVEKLKIEDYLSYKPTRDLLDNSFEDYITHNLEDKLSDMFNSCYEDSQESQLDLLALADREHLLILMLMKHHIVPKYTDEAVESKYNTDIMRSLLRKVEQEREEKEKEKTPERIEDIRKNKGPNV